MVRFRFTTSFLAVSALVSTAFANVPKGFEDPVVLGKVMKGDILVEQVMATKTEFRSVVRAYLKKVSPEAYADLYTSHKKWIGLLPEIKDAKTNSASPDKSEFTYWLHLKVKYGFFNFDVYPEGKQRITPAADAISEWVLYNEITNYKDQLSLAEETMRLIPYQDGILLEDNVHVTLAKPNSQSNMVKNEIEKKWVDLIGAFREELGGDEF